LSNEADFLTDAHFVLEPDVNWPLRRQTSQMSAHGALKVYSEASMIAMRRRHAKRTMERPQRRTDFATVRCRGRERVVGANPPDPHRFGEATPNSRLTGAVVKRVGKILVDHRRPARLADLGAKHIPLVEGIGWMSLPQMRSEGRSDRTMHCPMGDMLN
jgi:hypothetical protein